MALNNSRRHGAIATKQFEMAAVSQAAGPLESECEIIKPTPGARVIDLRGDSRFSQSVSGQTLAGSGAMVFEGEILENLNRAF